MDQKRPSFRADKKTILIVSLLIVALVGIPLTVYFLQQTQIVEQQAWHTTQSATAACGSDGNVVITVNFSNTESNSPTNAMNVTVRDTVTGGTVNLGTVNPGETKSGTITTNATSLAAGGVVFSLLWTNGRPGTDTRSASYPAVQPCPVQEPTEMPTIPVEEPTPTLTPTISDEPTMTPTDVPTVTPTPSTSSGPTATLTPTEAPTVTTVLTETPTPTTPESPTNTQTPPTEVVTSSAPTKTPFPTIAPSGPEDLFVGFGAAALVLTVLGGLLFFLL